MKDEIEQRFRGNLARVRGLVALYEEWAAGPGRVGVDHADILRAAVVFLHATLEDLVRSIVDWLLPTADAAALADVPLKGETTPKFTLSQLAAYRGGTVDEVIRASVASYLERSNYNDPSQVAATLKRVGLDPAPIEPYQMHIAPMMKRRHLIVHRVDRNLLQTGTGHHAALSISRAEVVQMLEAVESVGSVVVNQLASST